MGDFDNNQVNSSTFTSYEDPNLGISIDPGTSVSVPSEPVVDLTSTTSSGGDSFSRPLRLPRHLSPHDSIRVSDGAGGSRTLEIIELIREARSNPTARQQLTTLASAAASDPSLLNQCYVSNEENLIPMLAQLGSSDPVARREGALSLRQFILSHPEDRTLQQGLLATVADVARSDGQNTEARELLVSVARDRSPQNAGLRNWMQGQAQIAPLCNTSSSSPVANASNPAPVTPNGSGGATTLSLVQGGSGAVVATLASMLPGAAAPAAIASAVLTNPAITERLAAMIEQRTAGTPLEGVPTEGIVSFVQRNAGLPAGTFEDLLRLRILADALPLNGFTGNLFGTSTSVATLLSEDIRRVLNREGGSVSDAAPIGVGTALAEGSIEGRGAATLVPADGRSPVLVAHAPTVVPNAASNGENGGNALAFFVPALLTSLSGMQGLTSNPSSLGPTPLATLAMGLSGRSTYHVDGPTTIDEDGHQGFGGGSQGGGSNHEGGEGRDERHESPDSYLA
ncbi:MAG: hypothetical protein IT572_10170 [Deltaproteobacteria bacterium]|nr:hypothetical protein [Deltaproteobacteria bacterium]